MTLKPLLQFERFVDNAWAAAGWQDTHVVLAVSGGADSVAMLRAILELKRRQGGPGAVHVAHLHHDLRGAAADADQEWLQQLCGRFEVPIHVGHADVRALAARQGDGWEAAARSARYDFVVAAAEQVGARFVAVAHTADDQVETVLHRILRGTGLDGLAGMPVSRQLSPCVTLIRPLLNLRRTEVIEYLAEIAQDFRTDQSNTDLRFTRNRLRGEVLPMLRRQFNADVDSALLRLAQQAGETAQTISDMAERLAEKCVVVEQDADSAYELRVDCGHLIDQTPAVIREVFRAAWTRTGWPKQAVGYEVWQQLAELVLDAAERPAINLPGNVDARRRDGWLVLTRAPG